jgi:ribosomal protein S18 acetylase RimI-like enzyme
MSNDARVERAMPYDLPILNQISVESKMHWGYPLDWLQNWVETLRITRKFLEENHVYKISTDRIIGFCAIVKKPDAYEVIHLWIAPKYIGKGYGKKLLQETLQIVVMEKSEVIVESDPNSEKFYQSQGFVTFGQRESYPKGRFLPLMKRVFP